MGLANQSTTNDLLEQILIMLGGGGGGGTGAYNNFEFYKITGGNNYTIPTNTAHQVTIWAVGKPATVSKGGSTSVQVQPGSPITFTASGLFQDAITITVDLPPASEAHIIITKL